METLIENNPRSTSWEITDILLISRSIQSLVKMKNVFCSTEKTGGTFWPARYWSLASTPRPLLPGPAHTHTCPTPGRTPTRPHGARTPGPPSQGDRSRCRDCDAPHVWNSGAPRGAQTAQVFGDRWPDRESLSCTSLTSHESDRPARRQRPPHPQTDCRSGSPHGPWPHREIVPPPPGATPGNRLLSPRKPSPRAHSNCCGEGGNDPPEPV